jgi:hypothetical protein
MFKVIATSSYDNGDDLSIDRIVSRSYPLDLTSSEFFSDGHMILEIFATTTKNDSIESQNRSSVSLSPGFRYRYRYFNMSS